MNNKYSLIFTIAVVLSVTACGSLTKPNPKECQSMWDTYYNDAVTSFPPDNPFMLDINIFDLVYGWTMGADCSTASPRDSCDVMQSCLSSGWRPIQDTRPAAEITPIFLSTNEPTPTTGPSPTPEIGFARSRPAPLGDSIIVGDETIQVTNVIVPADNLVDSQMYALAENQEYIAVEISIVCNKTQDETCMGVDFSYSIVGSSGKVNDSTVIQVLGECIMCDTVYGGGTLKGYVVFIVDKSETNLVLVAEKDYDTTVYLLVKPSSPLTLAPTPLQLPTIQVSSAQYDDIFAWNYLAEQTSGNVIIQIARVLVGNKDSIENVIGFDFDQFEIYQDKPNVGEIFFIVTNNTNKTISIYPDQGTVVIGSEQIELTDYLFAGSSYEEHISGDIFPGVTATGYLWFGIKRTPLEEINGMMIAIGGPFSLENWESLGPDYQFQLDLTERMFQPLPEELK